MCVLPYHNRFGPPGEGPIFQLCLEMVWGPEGHSRYGHAAYTYLHMHAHIRMKYVFYIYACYTVHFYVYIYVNRLIHAIHIIYVRDVCIYDTIHTTHMNSRMLEVVYTSDYLYIGGTYSSDMSSKNMHFDL